VQTRRRAGSLHERALVIENGDTVYTRNQIAGVEFVGKNAARISIDFRCGFCDMLHNAKSAFEGTGMTLLRLSSEFDP
jgi:hypothetical protein